LKKVHSTIIPLSAFGDPWGIKEDYEYDFGKGIMHLILPCKGISFVIKSEVSFIKLMIRDKRMNINMVLGEDATVMPFLLSKKGKENVKKTRLQT
jgi:hypothetical protein